MNSTVVNAAVTHGAVHAQAAPTRRVYYPFHPAPALHKGGRSQKERYPRLLNRGGQLKSSNVIAGIIVLEKSHICQAAKETPDKTVWLAVVAHDRTIVVSAGREGVVTGNESGRGIQVPLACIDVNQDGFHFSASIIARMISAATGQQTALPRAPMSLAPTPLGSREGNPSAML